MLKAFSSKQIGEGGCPQPPMRPQKGNFLCSGTGNYLIALVLPTPGSWDNFPPRCALRA